MTIVDVLVPFVIGGVIGFGVAWILAPFVAGDTIRRWKRAVLRRWLQFWYRNQDPETCCCGSQIGRGGDICHHGGCRSMVDYTIDREVDRRFP